MLRRPLLKKRRELLQELKQIFRSHRSQPIGEVVEIINPILRGWVNYFAHGHASRCFSYVRTWVELKVRRHLARARKRTGFGWKRWSRRWIYEELKLFDGYRVKRQTKPAPIALPARGAP